MLGVEDGTLYVDAKQQRIGRIFYNADDGLWRIDSSLIPKKLRDDAFVSKKAAEYLLMAYYIEKHA